MAVIRTLLSLYILALMVDAILSYFPETRKYTWRMKLKRICDFSCDPVRRLLPSNLPLDFSPLIVIAAIKIFEILW